MRRLFEAVIGRNEMMRDYKMLDYDAAFIGLWSPGDYDDLEKKEPAIYLDYQRTMTFFKRNIRLEFWDTEDNVPGYDTISSKQADTLVDFIDQNLDRTFAIHCDAGQSRSAGVALAIECIIGYKGNRYLAGLDSSYTDAERYSPNRKVFDKIMDAWDRAHSDHE